MTEVSGEFDREYHQAGLIRGFYSHAKVEDLGTLDSWRAAVRKIDNEDHFLLVMIGAAGSCWQLHSLSFSLLP